MTSNAVILENPLISNSDILSANNKLNKLYETYKSKSPTSNLTRSPSLSSLDSFSSSSSSDASNKPNFDASTAKTNSNSTLTSSQRRETTLKIPYPVLSDHRDPSSILALLEKENQTTSKKISDVTKQIEICEQRLTSNTSSDNEKKTMKYERVKLKQQLDALKKHERRVKLQIDFVTTKTEIQGLEEKQKQIDCVLNSDENQQIKILLSKLKQQLDKMKVYMRTRNEQMKKIINSKTNLNSSNNSRKSLPSSSQKAKHLLSTTAKDMTRKRASGSINNDSVNKRLKPSVPNVRLTSRITSDNLKKNSMPMPVVRFVNKTTESRNNSASPTTPASSSSTLSPPLITVNRLGSTTTILDPRQRYKRTPVDDDNGDELDLELDMDELFNDDSCSQSTISRLKTEINDVPHPIEVKQRT